MPFFTLKQVQQTITIKNKKRISLIVPYKSTELLIFYQDCSYEHREVFGNKILHQGKMKFAVTELVKPDGPTVNTNIIQSNHESKHSQYVCLIGRKEDSVFFGILNIESKLYQPYESIFFETKIQCESPQYHLIANTISRYPLMIQFTPNVQNGIMIKCFDFKRRQWLNDILYLGSKYLNFNFLSVPDGLFGSQIQSYFCLIANGQKSQSIHISCLSITESLPKPQISQSHDDSFVLEPQQSTISVEQKQGLMHFVFTKELKYYRNFTFVGSHITSDGYLFLIGNSHMFETKEKKSELCQATSMYFSFINFANNLDSQYKFVSMKKFTIGREITVRDYLGHFEQSMLFIVQNPYKYSIHKLDPSKIISKDSHYDQELYTVAASKILRPQISLDSCALLSYDLVCEQFFQKIKDSPSVIKLNYLLKVSKKMYYHEIINKLLCAQDHNNEQFLQKVLSCL